MRKLLSILTALILVTAAPALAQYEAGGSYFFGDSSASYTAASYTPVLGPIALGAGIFSERAGGSVRLSIPLPLGLYADGQVVGGFRDDDFGLQWSAGGGYALDLFGPFALAADVRYRQDDPEVRGFWRTNEGAPSGVQVTGKLVIRP